MGQFIWVSGTTLLHSDLILSSTDCAIFISPYEISLSINIAYSGGGVAKFLACSPIHLKIEVLNLSIYQCFTEALDLNLWQTISIIRAISVIDRFTKLIVIYSNILRVCHWII
jgi:hypothetical protein